MKFSIYFNRRFFVMLPRKCQTHKAWPSRSTKRRSWGTNNEKINATHGTTDARRTDTEKAPWNPETAFYQKTVKEFSLRKHAHSNILKISPQKTESFQIKNSDIFYISAQKIDCEYSLEPPHRGGSNEYLQSMFLCRNKKNNVYPCKPHILYKSVV